MPIAAADTPAGVVQLQRNRGRRPQPEGQEHHHTPHQCQQHPLVTAHRYPRPATRVLLRLDEVCLQIPRVHQQTLQRLIRTRIRFRIRRCRTTTKFI